MVYPAGTLRLLDVYFLSKKRLDNLDTK